jgi:hypothetical protein
VEVSYLAPQFEGQLSGVEIARLTGAGRPNPIVAANEFIATKLPFEGG